MAGQLISVKTQWKQRWLWYYIIVAFVVRTHRVPERERFGCMGKRRAFNTETVVWENGSGGGGGGIAVARFRHHWWAAGGADEWKSALARGPTANHAIYGRFHANRPKNAATTTAAIKRTYRMEFYGRGERGDTRESWHESPWKISPDCENENTHDFWSSRFLFFFVIDIPSSLWYATTEKRLRDRIYSWQIQTIFIPPHQTDNSKVSRIIAQIMKWIFKKKTPPFDTAHAQR